MTLNGIIRFILLVWVSLLVSFAHASGPQLEDAHSMVNERIHALLALIETSKSSKKTSEQQRIALVDETLGDVVDYRRIARRVMAKYYKKASKEQKKRFFVVFKDSLLSTYANGLWEFHDYKVRLLPLKPTSAGKRKGSIGFEVVTSSGRIFPVNQSVFFHKKNQRWMVQNVIINGINMGQLFRDQFARLVVDNKGDIDLAISAWAAEIQLGREQLKADKL